MQIYSLSFIFVFLPVSMLIYYIIGEKYRYTVLGILSILFYYLAQPEYFWAFAVTLFAEYGLSELLSTTTRNGRNGKPVFIAALAANVAAILTASVLNQLGEISMPLGTMVIAFTSIGYFVDCYKDKEEYIHSATDFIAFTAFFGKLYRGPLVRAFDFREKMYSGKFPVENIGDGLYHFLRGIGKYVILAVPLSNVYADLTTANQSQMSMAGAWLYIFVAGMMVFYDLASFCDMARGLGMCFGLSLPKNFDFPYMSSSVTEFIDKFNITVTGFFRHYIYDNLRTKRDSVVQYVVDTFLISMLCGLWFGIRLSYVLWGVYIGLFIIAENTFLKEFLKKIPVAVRTALTFCIMMLSMTLFSSSDIGTLEILGGMFGRGGIPETSNAVRYIVSENLLLLAAGALFLTKALSSVFKLLKNKNITAYGICCFAECAAIIAMVTAELS